MCSRHIRVKNRMRTWAAASVALAKCSPAALFRNCEVHVPDFPRHLLVQRRRVGGTNIVSLEDAINHEKSFLAYTRDSVAFAGGHTIDRPGSGRTIFTRMILTCLYYPGNITA